MSYIFTIKYFPEILGDNNIFLNYKQNLKPFSDLIRLKTSILAGLGFILGLWTVYKVKNLLINPEFIFQSFLGFFGGFTLSGALNIVNDIQDLEIDKIIKPNRPLPSHSISIERGKYLAILLFTIAITISLMLFSEILIYILIIMILGLLYSFGLQNIPLLKNGLVAFIISTPLLLSAWLVEKENIFSNKVILQLFSLSVVSFTLFEWLKDLADLDGDVKSGKITIPRLIGSKASAVLIFSGFFLVLLLFWNFLGIFEFSFGVIIIMGIQLFILISSSKILWNQNPNLINQARKEIYAVFAITLIGLFLIS